MPKEQNLRKAALAVYLDVEEIAVNSYTTCTYPGAVFNDRIWRDNDGGFRAARELRTALGLKPFSFRDLSNFDGAVHAALANFRKL